MKGICATIVAVAACAASGIARAAPITDRGWMTVQVGISTAELRGNGFRGLRQDSWIERHCQAALAERA
jgi:hypothetical protein